MDEGFNKGPGFLGFERGGNGERNGDLIDSMENFFPPRVFRKGERVRRQKNLESETLRKREGI